MYIFIGLNWIYKHIQSSALNEINLKKLILLSVRTRTACIYAFALTFALRGRLDYFIRRN
jgi:hypothetical protein